MADDKNPDKDKDAGAKKEMTAKQAAAKVYRMVPLIENKKQKLNKDGVPVFKKQAINESEVLSFKDYGTHVVVVTEDGQKFTNQAA